MGVGTLCGGITLLPERATQIPLHEPHLLGLEVLGLKIEDTGMGQEAGKALVVVTGKEVNRIATVAGADSTNVVTIDVGLFLHVIDCTEVVTHVLATVVAADLGIPLGAEARQAATVRQDDNVAVAGHDAHVPAIAPELAHRRLRSALTEEDSGILLVGVEVGRVAHPSSHQLAVGGGHHALLDADGIHLSEHLIVDMGELNGLLAHLYAIDLVRSLVAVLASDNGLVVGECQTIVVTHAHGDGVHLLGGDIHAEDGLHALERADEIDGLLVGRPCDCIDTVVPILGQVLLVAGSIHKEDAVLVGFVAVMLHREPSHLTLAVDDGIGVVAHHALGQILGFTCF